MRLATASVLLLLAAPVLAQTPGDCALGTAFTTLDAGDVRARLFNQGNLFWDGGAPLYEVPEGSGISPLYAAGIWVGGHVGGELRTAAATYAQGPEGYEFYPGPLGDDGSPPEDCEPFDRIWKVATGDVAAYENSGATTPDLLDWPVALGAPVVDGDGIAGNYDLAAGDRPRVYGSETAFWVMNDVAGPHRTTLSPPIGIEVRVTAFSVASADATLGRATFYRYELEYRGDAPLTDAHFALWTDPDLGNFEDDYVGTDSTRHLAYVYNADNDDDDAAGGYGTNPPALGYDFFTGAGSTMWFFNSANATTQIPYLPEQFYHYMQGRWADGTPKTEGGEGLNPPGAPQIDFLFPGDPVVPTFWSERCPEPGCELPLRPDDVRGFVISTEEFELQPGETETVDFALLFAQGADHLDSVTELKAASDALQAAYDAGDLFEDPMPVAAEGEASIPTGVRLDAVYPNPMREDAAVLFSVAAPGPALLSVYDALGRRVRTLAGGLLAAGDHAVPFDAAGLPSGLYLVVLEASGQRRTRRVMLVR
jgi:hypothetical protein